MHVQRPCRDAGPSSDVGHRGSADASLEQAFGSGHEDRVSENRRLKLKNGKELDVRHAYSLPADADVRYVRTYFYNNVSGSILTYFTEYDGAGGFTDHTTHNISGSGWNSTLSPELAVIVAPVNRSYAMNVRIMQASPDLRFCGVRIQYFY